ncbi:hypothetical protein CG419_04040 [Latilactobacillus curvatus]|uniref:Phage tail fibre protein N-terminal domain-containing protein n=1 Tax=Latilactobacillus curvatus TaxID=28038 RepID=A0AAC9UP94_LATCU|nr:pyocin knob domain-containing protein [Latilactobacillus curvatus]ASN59845.1 hypothetical protein CG419_04040 [Latilactobacillus curvatus]
MTEKFNGAISATGVSLISQAIENNTKLQFLSVIGSSTSYTDGQLAKLTDTDLAKVSRNQAGHISNISVKDHDTVYFEITLDGNTVSADYGLNSVIILTKSGTTDHLFAILKSNQTQYMNAYDGKSSTNLQINVGFKITNTDAVSLEIDSAGTLTAADYKKLTEYTDSKSSTAESNANANTKKQVDGEAAIRKAEDDTEAKTRTTADNGLSKSIASEATTRTDADNAIKKDLSAVKNTADTAVHHGKPEQMSGGFKFSDNVTINGSSELKINTGSGSGDNVVLKGFNSGTSYGDMVTFGAGGHTIVGGGESARTLAQLILDGKVPGNLPQVGKDGEDTYIVADGNVHLISGFQDPAKAKNVDAANIVQQSDTTNWQKQPIFQPGTHRYAVCPSGKDFGEFLKSNAVPIGFSIIRDENAPATNFSVVKENTAWIYAIASQGTGVVTYVVSNGVGQGRKYTRNNDENDTRYMTRNNIIPASADLNDYKTAGFYFNSQTANAATMKNIPEKLAFSLEVTENAGCTQKFYTYLDTFEFSGIYVRNFYNNHWSAWKLLPFSDANTNSIDANTNWNNLIKSGTYLVMSTVPTAGHNNPPTNGGLWGFLVVQSSSQLGLDGFKVQKYYSAVDGGMSYVRTYSGANPTWSRWYSTPTDADISNLKNLITTHSSNKSNPHTVTAAQTGAYTKAETDTRINSHVNNKSNPHAVTAGQTGAYSKGEVDGKVKTLESATQELRTTIKGHHTTLIWMQVILHLCMVGQLHMASRKFFC